LTPVMPDTAPVRHGHHYGELSDAGDCSSRSLSCPTVRRGFVCNAYTIGRPTGRHRNARRFHPGAGRKVTTPSTAATDNLAPHAADVTGGPIGYGRCVPKGAPRARTATAAETLLICAPELEKRNSDNHLQLYCRASHPGT